MFAGVVGLGDGGGALEVAAAGILLDLCIHSQMQGVKRELPQSRRRNYPWKFLRRPLTNGEFQRQLRALRRLRQ